MPRTMVRLLLPALLVVLVSNACAAGKKDPRLALVASSVKAGLPPAIAAEIQARIDKAPERFLELLAKADAQALAVADLQRRVDKATPLPESYVPADLVALDGTGIAVSREGHRLRKPAFAALLAMEKAARADGISLVVGSAYRSYQYQVEVFARTAKELGSEAAADRISARPGKSQHQLGLALDFSPIDDAFAATKAYAWLERHAAAFGFSNSYPKGLESVTGYSWESWHWRYIGTAAVALQAEFFGGVQQYLVQFLEARAKAAPMASPNAAPSARSAG